jgi:hypothetical protein
VITEPGIYEMPAAEDLADPVQGGSLSSSGARLLLRSCPAMFDHRRQNPDRATEAMTLGTAAHAMILGAGRQPVEIPEDVLASNGAVSTKAAREFIAQAETDGKTPLKPRDMRRVERMAAAIRNHPVAGQRFVPGKGKPEQVLVWRDKGTGVMCRAMIDWLVIEGSGQPTITDLKTGDDASSDAFRRAVLRYRYDQQEAWYADGVEALGIELDPTFQFVVQETVPPYLVAVHRLDPTWRAIGRADNRKALNTYAACRASDMWPGYPEFGPLIPPAWMLDDLFEIEA